MKDHLLIRQREDEGKRGTRRASVEIPLSAFPKGSPDDQAGEGHSQAIPQGGTQGRQQLRALECDA